MARSNLEVLAYESTELGPLCLPVRKAREPPSPSGRATLAAGLSNLTYRPRHSRKRPEAISVTKSFAELKHFRYSILVMMSFTALPENEEQGIRWLQLQGSGELETCGTTLSSRRLLSQVRMLVIPFTFSWDG